MYGHKNARTIKPWRKQSNHPPYRQAVVVQYKTSPVGVSREQQAWNLLHTVVPHFSPMMRPMPPITFFISAFVRAFPAFVEFFMFLFFR